MATTDITPGPAVDCEFGCGAVTPVTEEDLRRGNDECPLCEEPGTLIRIETCGKGAECDHADHHFGTGFHHIEVPR